MVNSKRNYIGYDANWQMTQTIMRNRQVDRWIENELRGF